MFISKHGCSKTRKPTRTHNRKKPNQIVNLVLGLVIERIRILNSVTQNTVYHPNFLIWFSVHLSEY